MHVESPPFLCQGGLGAQGQNPLPARAKEGTLKEEPWIGEEEVEAILSHTLGVNKRQNQAGRGAPLLAEAPLWSAHITGKRQKRSICWWMAIM